MENHKIYVVGRQGFGSIMFLGETDVRRLNLDSLVQFDTREVIGYMDDEKKPPVGQDLNKAAEVTLLNIRCIDKSTKQVFTEGPRVEKYREQLKRKIKEQGDGFVSFYAAKGEWKFKVLLPVRNREADGASSDERDGKKKLAFVEVQI